MIRVAVSVEGQTEDEFCKQVLVPYFRPKRIEIYPVIIQTSRDKNGFKHKGGSVNLDRIESEIKKLLPSFNYVTTFYDLYGFETSISLTADEIEEKIKDCFDGNHRLIPYVQKYEFETLLFSDSDYYEGYFDNPSAKTEIEQIIASCGGIVENINNSKETAPSKRIINFFDNHDEGYDKVFHGPGIVNDIGLETIMQKCDRFKEWIEKIDNLQPTN